jgi:predicted dehydrogenase
VQAYLTPTKVTDHPNGGLGYEMRSGTLFANEESFMSEKVSWGIIGAGRIAGVFAKGIADSGVGVLAAVADIDGARADAFAEEFGIPQRYCDGEELLAEDRVEAVYVSTPHPFHAEWAIKAAEAGKHVLCEKPMGINQAETTAVVEAARANDVFLMEGYMYRCHPQTEKLVELIREGVIGEVRMIQADFAYDFPFDATSRVLDHDLAGGGILDVGGYPVSMARLIAGVARGEDYDDPVQVTGVGYIGPVSRVDEYAFALLAFESGIVAEVGTGVQLELENVVRVYGSEGWILVPSPWIPTQDGGTSTIVVHRHGGPGPQEIAVETEDGPWLLEARTMTAHLADRQPPPPAMGWDDSLGNMRALDMWRESIGLLYDSEKP